MQVMIEREAEDFLEKHGFRVADRKICTSVAQALTAAKKLKYPVVMKVVSQKIIHKSDVGGVVLDVKNDAEVKEEFARLKKLKGFEAVMMQRHLEGATVLVGVKKDPAFGHVVVVGAGGIYTEVFKDVSFRVCPITKDDAQAMIKETKYYDVLHGARGTSYPLQPIIQTLVKLSKLVEKNPTIEELDINPLLVDTKSGRIVDARIAFT